MVKITQYLASNAPWVPRCFHRKIQSVYGVPRGCHWNAAICVSTAGIIFLTFKHCVNFLLVKYAIQTRQQCSSCYLNIHTLIPLAIKYCIVGRTVVGLSAHPITLANNAEEIIASAKMILKGKRISLTCKLTMQWVSHEELFGPRQD